ncbi:MAG: 2Fe-2S iron-sulfur cluster-binding protein [Clostridia bacterium]|nr:2Fe-2S iron-sulfur cluster-binding protein [Clostridia bacterium]
MEKLSVVVNGMACEAGKGEILLDIARRNGIVIPTLCHNEVLRGQATCRICVVEVWEKGKKKIVTACIYPVLSDIEVKTHSEEIRSIRKNILMLLKAEAPESIEIQKLAEEYHAVGSSRFKVNKKNNCVMCGLCARACEELGSFAIATVKRGIEKSVAPPYEEPSETCIGCGSCAFVCPTNTIELVEETSKRKIWGKEFEMLECEVCGKHYVTKEQHDFMNKKLGEEQELVCKACKQKKFAEAMIEIYK